MREAKPGKSGQDRSHETEEIVPEWNDSKAAEEEFVLRFGARGATYRQVVASRKIERESYWESLYSERN